MKVDLWCFRRRWRAWAEAPALREALRKTRWVQVPPALARDHELYGVRGWLLVLVAWFVSQPAVHMLGAVLGAVDSGVSPYAYWETTTLSKPLQAVKALSAMLMVAMLIGKVRFFRLVAITLVLATTLASAAFATRISIESGIPLSANLVAGPAFYFIAWTMYLHRSVRVRVTFEHTIARADSRAPSTVVGTR